MKKKIVNLIVSAAVVTSMMFAVTACGSKDDSANNTTTGAVVESATPETTAPAEEPTVAATTEAATAEATTAEATTEATTDAEASGDSTSLEEWNSDVAVAMLDEMNQGLAGQGMTIKFEADGDTFSMIFVMEQELEITDEIKDAMKQLFDGSSAIFESARDELISETGNENIKLRITYQDINGTELYSQDF